MRYSIDGYSKIRWISAIIEEISYHSISDIEIII